MEEIETTKAHLNFFVLVMPCDSSVVSVPCEIVMERAFQWNELYLGSCYSWAWCVICWLMFCIQLLIFMLTAGLSAVAVLLSRRGRQVNMNVSYEISHLSARAHLWGITLCCQHWGETITLWDLTWGDSFEQMNSRTQATLCVGSSHGHALLQQQPTMLTCS